MIDDIPLPANDDDSVSPPGSPEGDSVRHLLTAAGPGPVPRGAARAEAKRVAQAVWQEKVASHAVARHRRRQWTLAVAATVVAALGAFLLVRPEAPADAPTPGAIVARVATVETLWNRVQVSYADRGGVSFLASGDTLEAQSEVRTGGKGRAALRLATGHALRLDVATRVRLGPDATIFLEEGAVYVDSSGAVPGTAVEVHQALGVVYEVGTQFEVRIVDDGLRVRVREGAVDVEVDGARHSAPAGEEITVGGEGTVVRSETPSWGEGWSWILLSAPPFDLEGQTVAEMLDWVARETGWRVTYADAGLADEAAGIVVHSSVEGLRPDEAPGLVLPSSGLDFELRDGELVVRRP